MYLAASPQTVVAISSGDIMLSICICIYYIAHLPYVMADTIYIYIYINIYIYICIPPARCVYAQAFYMNIMALPICSVGSGGVSGATRGKVPPVTAPSDKTSYRAMGGYNAA